MWVYVSVCKCVNVRFCETGWEYEYVKFFVWVDVFLYDCVSVCEWANGCMEVCGRMCGRLRVCVCF